MLHIPDTCQCRSETFLLQELVELWEGMSQSQHVATMRSAHVVVNSK